jgi:hypothetical protein
MYDYVLFTMKKLLLLQSLKKNRFLSASVAENDEISLLS